MVLHTVSWLNVLFIYIYSKLNSINRSLSHATCLANHDTQGWLLLCYPKFWTIQFYHHSSTTTIYGMAAWTILLLSLSYSIRTVVFPLSWKCLFNLWCGMSIRVWDRNMQVNKTKKTKKEKKQSRTNFEVQAQSEAQKISQIVIEAYWFVTKYSCGRNGNKRLLGIWGET